MVKGGDILYNNGLGQVSAFGSQQFNENYIHLHNRQGLLSMNSTIENHCGSQFFISFAPLPHLCGQHVVFGEIINAEGFKILAKINNYGLRSCVLIQDCGEIKDYRYQFQNENKQPIISKKMKQNNIQFKNTDLLFEKQQIVMTDQLFSLFMEFIVLIRFLVFQIATFLVEITDQVIQMFFQFKHQENQQKQVVDPIKLPETRVQQNISNNQLVQDERGISTSKSIQTQINQLRVTTKMQNLRDQDINLKEREEQLVLQPLDRIRSQTKQELILESHFKSLTEEGTQTKQKEKTTNDKTQTFFAMSSTNESTQTQNEVIGYSNEQIQTLAMSSSDKATQTQQKDLKVSNEQTQTTKEIISNVATQTQQKELKVSNEQTQTTKEIISNVEEETQTQNQTLSFNNLSTTRNESRSFSNIIDFPATNTTTQNQILQNEPENHLTDTNSGFNQMFGTQNQNQESKEEISQQRDSYRGKYGEAFFQNYGVRNFSAMGVPLRKDGLPDMRFKVNKARFR